MADSWKQETYIDSPYKLVDKVWELWYSDTSWLTPGGRPGWTIGTNGDNGDWSRPIPYNWEILTTSEAR